MRSEEMGENDRGEDRIKQHRIAGWSGIRGDRIGQYKKPRERDRTEQDMTGREAKG